MPILAQSGGLDDMVYRGILPKVISCTSHSEKAAPAVFLVQRSPYDIISLCPEVAFLSLCPTSFFRNSGAQFHAKAHISTQPSSPLQGARLSHAYEDQERSRSAVPPAREGPHACLSVCGPPRLIIPRITRDEKFCFLRMQAGQLQRWLAISDAFPVPLLRVR